MIFMSFMSQILMEFAFASNISHLGETISELLSRFATYLGNGLKTIGRFANATLKSHIGRGMAIQIANLTNPGRAEQRIFSSFKTRRKCETCSWKWIAWQSCERRSIPIHERDEDLRMTPRTSSDGRGNPAAIRTQKQLEMIQVSLYGLWNRNNLPCETNRVTTASRIWKSATSIASDVEGFNSRNFAIVALVSFWVIMAILSERNCKSACGTNGLRISRQVLWNNDSTLVIDTGIWRKRFSLRKFTRNDLRDSINRAETKSSSDRDGEIRQEAD
jgi:hypothetical protein